jgi:methionine sulfoxide reductase heme-binding subunit
VNLSWYLIRGSGFVAFGLLTASVAWGLMISSKVFGRAIKAKGLQWLHESLGLAALLATIAHMVALYLDNFIEFTWFEILVPGVGDWNPLAIAFGSMAFWTMALVSLTFYVKKWIGQTRWRKIHYLSFGVFAAAVGHGVLAGTDTNSPFAIALYITSVATVVLLTTIRILGAKEPATSTTRSTAAAARAES